MIELLVVIILIGVIALIVSPIVIGTIKKSKKATFERSIDGIIDSVRIDYSDDKFIAPREYYYDRTNLTLLTVNEKTRDEEVKITGKIEMSWGINQRRLLEYAFKPIPRQMDGPGGHHPE